MRKSTSLPIAEQVRKVVYAWPQWSPAEQKKLEDIYEEILAHVINGTGNKFVQEWCKKFLD